MADISDKNKFIFIHIPKNAGSSITSTLRKKGNSRFIKNLNMHVPAITLSEHLDTFDEYFKFAFVRNPWDRAYSLFKYRKKKFPAEMNGIPFLQYLNMEIITKGCEYQKPIMSIHSKSQLDWLTDEHGKIIADYIGRCEDIRTDFKHVCNRIGIASSKLNTINATPGKNYRDVYTDKTRELIATRFARDIEMFGYEF